MEENITLLYNLPYEVLLIIFERCDVVSLRNLSLTCKKFCNIIHNEDVIWKGASMSVIGSNMASPYMQKRCKPILSYKDRIITSKKWLRSLGKMTLISKYMMCMPWMTLDIEHIYLSRGEKISAFKRGKNGSLISRPYISTFPFKEDITRFVVNEKEVVCAGSGGDLVRTTRYFKFIDLFKADSGPIYAVDMKKNIIVSGSTSIKIWSACTKETVLKREVTLGNRVLSTAIMPSNSSFFVGTPGTKFEEPLQLFDLERCCHINNFGTNHRYGAGILDINPECYHTALTCGYDSTLQLWDIRCPQNSVAVWNEPFDSCLYCVKSDHNVTIITGSSCNACCLVWDKRVLRLPLKTYFIPDYSSSPCWTPIIWNPRPPLDRYHRGPVFSIAFDATHIFLALQSTSYQFSYT